LDLLSGTATAELSGATGLYSLHCVPPPKKVVHQTRGDNFVNF